MPGRVPAVSAYSGRRGASAAGPFCFVPGARAPARRCRDGTPVGRRDRPTPAPGVGAASSCCLCERARL